MRNSLVAACAVWFIGFGSVVGLVGCADAQQPGIQGADAQGAGADEAGAGDAKEGHAHTNQLIHETSPYLLQHAHNPVDWFPWGPAAFAKARKENKPIFLSVGYSTCYWCHVMERESFEREDVAEILNKHFVAIKVDREERPELDQQFMVASQLVSGGRGGWPNSVWLTPTGEPWMAGTYFPREQFKQVLTHLAKAWDEQNAVVLQQAGNITAAIRRTADARAAAEPLSRDLIAKAVAVAEQRFDTERGGFGGAPKFPPHAMLTVLGNEYERQPDEKTLQMITTTLREMARGGVCDQVGGGFHRYSTDADWLLPHFEKMLYDNGQLMRPYTDAALVTDDPLFRDTIEGVYVWLQREMTSPEGGFYSALDSESDAEEGKYYVWSHAEVMKILGPADGRTFAAVYGIQPGGNFKEEASSHQSTNNIPHRRESLLASAKQLEIDSDVLSKDLAAMRLKLLEARADRSYPHLDDKIIAAWNGLMIDGLAYAGRKLDEPKYTAAARAAADFVLDSMVVDGKLRRTFRDGRSKLDGYLNDYAFISKGLLELHRATADQRYLDAAVAFADVMLRDFQDTTGGGFYFTARQEKEIAEADVAGFVIRSKNLAGGGNLPSGNGVAAELMLDLAELTGDNRYRIAAEKTLENLSGHLSQYAGNPDHLLVPLSRILDAGDVKSSSPNAPNSSFAVGVIRGDVAPSSSTVKPGETFEVEIRIAIDNGWHLYAANPDAPFIKPTELTIEDSGSVSVVAVELPEGIQKADAAIGETLAIYEREVVLSVKLKVSRDAKAGIQMINAVLDTQACDDQKCLPPESTKVQFAVNVIGDE